MRGATVFYLDVLSLPFPLTGREGAFVVGGVRAEGTPHAQPAGEPPGGLSPESRLQKTARR